MNSTMTADAYTDETQRGEREGSRGGRYKSEKASGTRNGIRQIEQMNERQEGGG